MPGARSLVVALGLLLAGCAAPGPAPAGPAPSTMAGPSPSAAADPTLTSLPGEPVDLYPQRGARLAVVGVAADDALSVRTAPGPEFPELRRLPPLATGFQATGHSRSLADRSWWVEVLAEGATGWVNAEYVAQPGRTTDVTAELGRPPQAATVTALTDAVAAARAQDSSERPRVTVVDGPRGADPTELRFDVLGLPDDSRVGERLRLVAARTGTGYTVRTLEATPLCMRAVTADGVCL